MSTRGAANLRRDASQGRRIAVNRDGSLNREEMTVLVADGVDELQQIKQETSQRRANQAGNDDGADDVYRGI
nr:hypothetical protein Iba_chr14bCG5950 [Ipomoea batatas]